MGLKKKSIVLLLTLFIITAISLIILTFLKENEKIISYSFFDKDLAQINLLIKDINKEILAYMKKTGDDLDEELPANLPFDLKGIKLNFDLELTNFEDNIVINKNLFKNLQNNEIILENVEFLYDFTQIFKNKNITSFYQINYLIDKYKKITNDKKILNIKDLLIYPKIKNSKYKLFYTIDSNDNKADILVFISKDYNIDDIYIRVDWKLVESDSEKSWRSDFSRLV